ncbi:MAG TPA: hypothetical protein PLV59_01740 [Candidatus Dojkabacteria bacterium]|nr:hypothetical protein [Candidatus Dojkabacteria bacterium]
MLFIPTTITVIITLLAIYLISPTTIENINIPKFEEMGNRANHTTRHVTKFRLPIEDKPAEISWYSKDTLILQTESQIKLFNVIGREFNDILTLDTNEYAKFGEENSKIVCTWQNQVKKKPEDIGTVIRMIVDSKEVRKMELGQTVKVDNCKKERLIVSNAFDFMERKQYEIVVETGEVYERDIEEIFKAEIEWKQNDRILTINGNNNKIASIIFTEEVFRVHPSSRMNSFLIETQSGYWIILLP